MFQHTKTLFLFDFEVEVFSWGTSFRPHVLLVYIAVLCYHWKFSFDIVVVYSDGIPQTNASICADKSQTISKIEP